MTTARRTKARAPRILVLSAAVWFLGASIPARAEKQQKIIDRMIQLNKIGMDDLDTAEFAGAKAALVEAMKLGKRGGLDSHPIMARTYIHMGALASMGWKYRRTAKIYFMKALKIQPDIEPEKTFRTGSVGPIFLKARQRWQAAVAADKAADPSEVGDSDDDDDKPVRKAQEHAKPSRGSRDGNQVPIDASRLQWSLWIGGGGGQRDIGTRRRRSVIAPRIGAGLSFRLTAFNHSAYELRWGPWLVGETQLDGGLGEGGLALMLVPIRAARAAYELRAGGGLFADRLSRSGEVSVTLTCGTRSVAPSGSSAARSGSDSDSADEAEAGDPEDATARGGPDTLAFANGVRVFVEGRSVPVRGRGISVLGGLEITPSLFFPPYKSERWVGGWP